jgi:hypothetical protein
MSGQADATKCTKLPNLSTRARTHRHLDLATTTSTPLRSRSPPQPNELTRGAAKRFGPKTLSENLDWLVTPNQRAGHVGHLLAEAHFIGVRLKTIP